MRNDAPGSVQPEIPSDAQMDAAVIDRISEMAVRSDQRRRNDDEECRERPEHAPYEKATLHICWIREIRVATADSGGVRAGSSRRAQ